MIVSTECYKTLSSILNDFGKSRTVFTYAEFAQAVKSIGFGTHSPGILIPPSRFGNKMFCIGQNKNKMNRLVSPAVQDEWKRELFKLYGWTAETFRCR